MYIFIQITIFCMSHVCVYIYQLITCLKARNFILVKYLLVSVNFVVINFLIFVVYFLYICSVNCYTSQLLK